MNRKERRRQAALAKVGKHRNLQLKLRAVIEHPGTSEREREAARVALRRAQ